MAEKVRMVLVLEEQIRENCASPGIAMLDLWHQLCDQRLGRSLDVTITSRRDMQLPPGLPENVSTGAPMEHPELGKVLNLVLDFGKEFMIDDLLWTHELCHWILMLQGFPWFMSEKVPSLINSHFNAIAHHTPIFELQRSFGFDPQSMIDERTRKNVHAWSKMDEKTAFPPHRLNWVDLALRAADDLIGSSQNLRTEMLEMLRQKYRKTARFVATILDTADHYDLNDPGSNGKFQRRLVRNLKLGSGWYFDDPVARLSKWVQD